MAMAFSWHASNWLQNFPLNTAKSQTANTRKCSGYEIVAQKKVQKTQKIILMEDVSKLGKKGELLSVKTGYFRNYLFPRGQAQIATADYLKEIRLEQERKEAEKRRVKEEAESLALMFRTVGAFKVKRKGGKGKLIFGTVTSQDLADIIKSQLQRDIDKRIITLPEIREVGQYIAEIKLHPEVTAQVRLNVIAN
eukprot:Gb_34312 [translate_table: standard]